MTEKTTTEGLHQYNQPNQVCKDRPGGSSLDAVRPQGGALVGVAVDGLETSNDIHAKHSHIYTV